MNNLSWLIYFAESIPKLGLFTFGLGLLCLVGSGFLWLFTGVGASKTLPYPVAKSYVGLSLLALSCLLPSSKTIYMIAASEAGETVVYSKQGQELLNSITTTIQQKLKEANNGTR